MFQGKLDETDLKIVHALRNDARQSITDLAKYAGISRPTAMKRLNRMIKEGMVGVDGGLNLTKLGFRIGCMGLEVEGAESRSYLKKILLNCPRVLIVLCPFEKISFSVYVFGEDQETLRSTIYGFNAFPNTKISYVNYSDPPLYPKTFPVRLNLKKGAVAPCGRKCSDCFSYKQNLCIGCPAVDVYKGPL